MRRRITKEQKVAEVIASSVSDVSLDLDEIGKAIALGQPTVLYNRLILVAESAVEEKENERNIFW